LLPAVTSAIIDAAMNETTVELTVGPGCCIECAAKREYNRMVLRIMTSDEPPAQDAESRLELLVEFLETADFPLLRGSNEIFDGTREALCLLGRSTDGKPFVSVTGR